MKKDDMVIAFGECNSSGPYYWSYSFADVILTINDVVLLLYLFMSGF